MTPDTDVVCLSHLRRLASYAVRDPAMWFDTPMALAFAPHVRSSLTVYDCMDELVVRIADTRPDGHLVMVRDNIHWLGSRPYEDLPVYIAGWDAYGGRGLVRVADHEDFVLTTFRRMAALMREVARTKGNTACSTI